GFAVRREYNVGDLLADRHRVDERHLLARDAQHGNRVVGAIGDQGEIAGPIDRHTRGLLANGDRIDQRRWIGRKIDHVDLVVESGLPARPFLLPLHRVRHQRQRLVRRNREVGRRSEDRVQQRQRDDDPWRQRIGPDVDDRYGVLAGRAVHEYTGIVDAYLFFVAANHQLAF